MEIPTKMRAVVMEAAGKPLRLMELAVPEPAAGQVLIMVNKVAACGVCRTDLHIIYGELPHPKLPLVPGHEVVSTVVKTGSAVVNFHGGERVGVPWLGKTCGTYRYCIKGRENLCENPGFTGYTLDGGYATYLAADQHYCFAIPEEYADNTEAAPLLCAGLIGYRSYRMAGSNLQTLGIYGFGAAAHIIAQIAVQQGIRVYAFTSPDDVEKQAFARELSEHPGCTCPEGAAWSGGSDELPAGKLDAAIIFAPVGALVPAALKAVDKGGWCAAVFT